MELLCAAAVFSWRSWNQSTTCIFLTTKENTRVELVLLRPPSCLVTVNLRLGSSGEVMKFPLWASCRTKQPFHKTVHRTEPQTDNISQKESLPSAGEQRVEGKHTGTGDILKDIWRYSNFSEAIIWCSHSVMAECHYFCAPITQVHPALQEIDCWRIGLE